jgi:hypothetical protein
MAENIDNTVGGTGLYNTKIPSFDEAADIQAALRLYHYGSSSYDTTNTDPAQLPNPSLARHLKILQDDIDSVDAKGIGSVYSATAPTSPIDGYVWMDSTTSSASSVGIPTAVYTNSAPTTGLTDGLLWVDKDSSPLKMYIYNATSSDWKEIGA